MGLVTYRVTTPPNLREIGYPPCGSNHYASVFLFSASPTTLYQSPNGDGSVNRFIMTDPRKTDPRTGIKGHDEWWFVVSMKVTAGFKYPWRWLNWHDCAGGGVTPFPWYGVSPLAFDYVGPHTHDDGLVVSSPHYEIVAEYGPANTRASMILPKPEDGLWHDWIIRVVFGRTDGSSVRPGELDVWLNGNDTPVISRRNYNTQSDDPTTWGRYWINLWCGNYHPVSHLTPPSAQSDFTLPRVGKTLFEALADRPTFYGTDAYSIYYGCGTNYGDTSWERLADFNENAFRVPTSLGGVTPPPPPPPPFMNIGAWSSSSNINSTSFVSTGDEHSSAWSTSTQINAAPFGAFHFGSWATSYNINAIPPDLPLEERYSPWTSALAVNAVSRYVYGANTYGTDSYGGIDLSILPFGIASEEAFGTLIVPQNITVTGISSEEALGAVIIQISSVIVAVTGITSEEAFGAIRTDSDVQPAGMASQEAFGAPKLNIQFSVVGITSEEAFGETATNQRFSVTGVASEEAFGTVTAKLVVSTAGIGSEEAFGAPKLNVSFSVVGIDSQEAFGAGAVTIGLAVFPAGIASGEAFGTLKLNQKLVIVGITSEEAFSIIEPILPSQITVVGITSQEAFGTITTIQPNVIFAIGISSEEAFGHIFEPASFTTKLKRTRWEFVLANSDDMTRIGSLIFARNKQLTLALNEPGSANFTMPVNSDLAQEISPVEHCIMVLRDDEVVWSGPVWTIEENLPDETMNVVAVGWFEELNHRFLPIKMIFTDVDAATIVNDAISSLSTYSPPAPYVRIGYTEPTQIRSATYEKFYNIGRMIKELSDVESGFDFIVDPITRTLEIYGQYMTDRPNALFAYNVATSNIQNVRRIKDGSILANYVTVQGGAGSLAEFAEDTISEARYGRLEDYITIGTVQQGIAGAYAGVEVALRSLPRVSWEIVPMPYSESVPQPRLFKDYYLGDKVYLSVDYGNIKTEKQAMRVFKATLQIDDEDNEQVVSLETAIS